MICERCGHDDPLVTGIFTHDCIANLRAALKIERTKRQATEMLVQRMVEDHEDVKQRLAESRQKELDAETRACAAEERAHRLEAVLRAVVEHPCWANACRECLSAKANARTALEDEL